MKEPGKINFKNIFYLNQYSQNIIISACNQCKGYLLNIYFYPTNC